MKKNSIKIGLTGTHSTGKTTFLDRLESSLRAFGYAVERVDDLAVAAKSRDFPILREHNWESTLWIATQGISLELEAARKSDVILVDRAVPDVLGYLRAALATRKENLPSWQIDTLEALIKNYSKTYDVLIKTKIDSTVPIEDDNRRDTEPEFRNLVDTKINEVVNELNIPFWLLSTQNEQRIMNEVLAKITDQHV